METTSKKNAEGTEMWIDREELKSVIDDTSIGTMTGAIIMTCDTDGVLFKIKGTDDALLKALTHVAQHDMPFLVLMMRAIENIKAELEKEGGEA